MCFQLQMSSAEPCRALCCHIFCCCQVSHAGESEEQRLTKRSVKNNIIKKKMERIEIVESEEQVVKCLIQYIEGKAKEAIAERNRFVIGLSGTV